MKTGAGRFVVVVIVACVAAAYLTFVQVDLELEVDGQIQEVDHLVIAKLNHPDPQALLTGSCCAYSALAIDLLAADDGEIR